MFTHLSTTLEGLFSIRLYQAQEQFDSFNRSLIDSDHKALYSLNVIKTLQSFYIDIVSCFAIYFAALIIVLTPSTNSAVAGLAMSNIFQLLILCQWTARLSGDLRSSMSCVATVIDFSSHIPSETTLYDIKPDNDWPALGEVQFFIFQSFPLF
jgi:hypothetical protein